MILIRPLRLSDYMFVAKLWRTSNGAVLLAGNSARDFLTFLDCDPGINLGAFVQSELVGVAMVGYRGRCGYLYHLAVTPKRRRSGIDKKLVEQVLRRLSRLGIERLHVFTEMNNNNAKKFWATLSWPEQLELVVFFCMTDR
jgi:N-acetylglutamate synthase